MYPEKNLLDILWVIVCSGIVLLMQAGFLVLESGLTRAKNSINVAIKNVADFGIATLLFYCFGFGLMFGQSFEGLLGTTMFFPVFSKEEAWPAAFFLFQLVFCGTSATIVSGAVAERLKFQSYLLVTVLVSGFIYPVAGHWSWGGNLSLEPVGWLKGLGFHDFAGSTIVHSVGGWVSLALLLVLGSRKGRFDIGIAKRINGSNLPVAMFGGILLWFGWLGFNGGSTLGFNSKVPGIIVNTVMASGISMLTAMIVSWLAKGVPQPSSLLNGSLIGAVAITAGADLFSVVEAGFIGFLAGLLLFPSEELLEKFKIDDAVGAIPVHLVGGIWGSLSVGILADYSLLGFGDRISLLEVQLLGILSVGIFVFATSYLVFLILNRVPFFGPLRVGVKEEEEGLNLSEHNARTDLVDLLRVMEHQHRTGDLCDVYEEPFTEVGQIAKRYNLVLKRIRETLNENENARTEIAYALETLQKTQDKLILSEKMASLGQLVSGIAHEINNPLGAISALSGELTDYFKHISNRLSNYINMFSSGTVSRIDSILNMIEAGTAGKIRILTRSERKVSLNRAEDILKKIEFHDPLSTASQVIDVGFLSVLEKNEEFFADKSNHPILEFVLSEVQSIRNVESIRLAVERTSKITYALKNYSHIEAISNKIPSDVVGTLETVLIIYNNKIINGVDLKLEFDSRPIIPAFPDDLMQVWTNLIHNSLQAIEFKGKITISVKEFDQDVRIEVTDNGPGIPTEMRSRIFEPFFTTKPRGEGSGLGLDICKRIIEKHGGRVVLESEPGKTTFYVFLPKS
ncbi:ammonium transporter [Leptospira fluminis]|uniref:Ammonium transporter n=1 Tax=Leptospira fluminis TaxID=2484979 RepID=A0A4R9GP46_9LEPT|nr:ammonium transporter [Leptospira fluminis]TGK18737.1 ammonium transporter [Leptospira fluminis]